MIPVERKYDREEFARRGVEVYQQRVVPRLHAEDRGKFVATDIETAEYEVDEDDYSAVMRLRKRLPEAQIWLSRVGEPAAHRFGRRSEAGGR